MKEPSKKRGCEGKMNLGRGYRKSAEKMSAKHGKDYGVYRCPHCGGTHLTTKLDKQGDYSPLIYTTTEKKEPKKRRVRTKYQEEYRQKPENVTREVVAKEKQRAQEALVRFHIRRKVICKIPVPESIRAKPCYDRVWDAYQVELGTPINVEEKV